MGQVSRTIIGRIGRLFHIEIERFAVPVIRSVKKIGFGLLFMFLAIPFWAVGVFLLLLATFSYVAHYDQLVLPALWTALFAGIIGGLTLLLGSQLLKKR